MNTHTQPKKKIENYQITLKKNYIQVEFFQLLEGGSVEK